MSSFIRRLERGHNRRKNGSATVVGPAIGVRNPNAPKPNSLGARGGRRKTKHRPFKERLT